MFATLEELRQRRSIKWRLYPDDVLPAWIAEMDFTLAEPIARELRAAIEQSDIGYRDSSGLGEAFAGFANRAWGWQVEPRRVTAVGDVVTGVAQALVQLTKPGTTVVINPPVYPPFYSSIRDVADRPILEVPMRREDDGHYGWDLEGLDSAFARPEVGAFVMCHPHNPTGSVASREVLEAIAQSAARNDVVVVADEIHGPLTLPGAEHIPYLAVAGGDSQAVCVTSASKSWNIPGLKCAMIIANERTSASIAGMPLEVGFGTGHLGVIAAIAAFDEGEQWLRDAVDVIDSNRTLLDRLVYEKLPDVCYAVPAASYLGWLDFRAIPELGANPADVIMEKGRVALSPGPNYGAGGEGFARVNFGTSPDILREIVDRIAVAVEAVRA